MAYQGPAPDSGFLQRITAFLGASVLAGVLAAVLVLPAAGGLALTTSTAATGLRDLPGDLDALSLSQRSEVRDADGNVIARFYDQNRDSVAFSDVASVMGQAILAIEDARFYQHGGIDLRGTLRALLANLRSGNVVQGGSSITQQLAKNIGFQNANAAGDEPAQPRARTIGNKLGELRYALALEKQLPKDKILELYLNTVYFGSGAYGIEAAAQRYFSKPAAKLTLPEAALLAGLVSSPSAYSPLRDMAKAAERRNTVLARMAELDMISPEDAANAQRTKVALEVSRPRNGCVAGEDSQKFAADFFCEYVRAVIRTDPVFGETQEKREQLLNRGGLTITTTLNPRMQRAAEEAIKDYVYPTDPAAAAIVMVEPGTGKLLAMAQSRPNGSGKKGVTTLNYSVDKKRGGTNGFQAGSTAKSFVAAAAFEQGIMADTAIYSPYRINMSGEEFTTCDGVTSARDWAPVNTDPRENGVYDMTSAMAESVNTFWIQLEQRTGLCDPVTLAEKMGLRRGNGEPLSQVPSFTLGVNEVTPLAMAEAYATFAARGTHCDTIAIASITDQTGKELKVPSADCQEVLEPELADAMNALLRNVIDGPYPYRTGEGLSLGRPAAGKTGTTQELGEAWFVGHTPNLAAAVWVGTPANNTSPMVNIRIGSRYYSRVYGATVPGPIWRQAMRNALEDVPEQDFVEPAARYRIGFRQRPTPENTNQIPFDSAPGEVEFVPDEPLGEEPPPEAAQPPDPPVTIPPPIDVDPLFGRPNRPNRPDWPRR